MGKFTVDQHQALTRGQQGVAIVAEGEVYAAGEPAATQVDGTRRDVGEFDEFGIAVTRRVKMNF